MVSLHGLERAWAKQYMGYEVLAYFKGLLPEGLMLEAR
jgi:hypothetical protein